MQHRGEAENLGRSVILHDSTADILRQLDDVNAGVAPDFSAASSQSLQRIKVYVRVRPQLKEELADLGSQWGVEIEGALGGAPPPLLTAAASTAGPSNWIRIARPDEPRRHFTRVWGPKATQEEIFRTIGAPTVDDVLDGYFGTVIAYGQTGTGKTFTLGCTTPGIEGLQHRCLQYLYDRKVRDAGLPTAAMVASADVDHTDSNDAAASGAVSSPQAAAVAAPGTEIDTAITLHYVQIYRETIMDLCPPAAVLTELRNWNATGSGRKGSAGMAGADGYDPAAGPADTGRQGGASGYGAQVAFAGSSAAFPVLTKDGFNPLNLPLRVDEGLGAAIDGVTVKECNTLEQALAFTRDGDNNRVVLNTRMNSASSRSHAILFVDVVRKRRATGITLHGRLIIADLAGSERIEKSGVDGDAQQEASAINQSLTVLGQCIASLVNKDGRPLSFRDSKITRLLQHPLLGRGRTSVIATVRPDLGNLQETLSTLRFAQRAQKVESQMTPQGWRDVWAAQRWELVKDQQRLADAAVIIAEAKQRTATRVANIRAQEQQLDRTHADMDQFLRGVEQERIDAQSAMRHEFELLQAQAWAATEQEKADIRKEHEATFRRMEERIHAELALVQRQQKKKEDQELAKLGPLNKEMLQLQEQLDAFTVDEESVADVVARRREAVLKEIESKRALWKRTRPSANKSVSSIHELHILKTRAMLLLDSIVIKRDGLKAKAKLFGVDTRDMLHDGGVAVLLEKRLLRSGSTAVAGVDAAAAPPPRDGGGLQPMSDWVVAANEPSKLVNASRLDAIHPGDPAATTAASAAVTIQQGLPTPFELMAYAQRAHEERRRREEAAEAATTSSSSSSSSSSAPSDTPSPPSSPYPSSSSRSLPTVTTPSISQTSQRRRRAGRSARSVTSKEPDDDLLDGEVDEYQRTADAFFDDWRKQQEETFESGAHKYELVRKFYDIAVQEEDDLGRLKEEMFRNLQTGTAVYVAQPPTVWLAWIAGQEFPDNPLPTTIVKAFLSLNINRTGIVLAPADESLGPPREMLFGEIQCALGQYSASFAASLEGMPGVPGGTPMPPTAARITPPAVPLFFYRSFTIALTASNATVDVVVDTDADFEAWCAAFLFLGFIEPVWGQSMDVSTAPRVGELLPQERLCCEYHHIYPEMLLNFRAALLRLEPPPLFLTPIRIRQLAKVDILHAFKLLSFLVSNGDVESVKIHTAQYKEYLQAAALATVEKEIIRALRIRIVNMLRRYRPSPAAVVQEYLKSIAGFEKEALDALVAQYGPEPNQVNDDVPAEMQEPSEEQAAKSDTEKQVEAQEIAMRSQFGFIADMRDQAQSLARKEVDFFLRSKFPADTVASRLEVFRRSILTNEKLQHQLSLFIDVGCVPDPWLVDHTELHGSAVDNVLAFARRGTVGSDVDRVLLVTGPDGSGKTLLCHFVVQFLLCTLDLDAVAANAANSNSLALLTAASIGSTLIPVYVHVGSCQNAFSELLIEGLSRTFGVDLSKPVPENSVDLPLVTLDHLKSLDIVFFIDGVDELVPMCSAATQCGEPVVVELLKRFAASVEDDPKSRLLGSNKMESWGRAKFVVTCRHVPQSHSDRMNTNVRKFLTHFVAPTAKALGGAAASAPGATSSTKSDASLVSTMCLCPFGYAKQLQYLHRYIYVTLKESAEAMSLAMHVAANNETFFQRGFAGVDCFINELKKVRDWFVYARNPSLLGFIVPLLPYAAQEPDGPDKAERHTLAWFIQQGLELGIRQRIEQLGLAGVPPELQKKDSRQALNLFVLEQALAMARTGASCRFVPPLTRPVSSKLAMLPLAEDPAVSYIKSVGPFHVAPLMSPGLNPSLVTLRRFPPPYVSPFAVLVDETLFLNRQIRDFYVAYIIAKQLVSTPGDPANFANTYNLSHCAVLGHLVYDLVGGKEKLFFLVQLAKKAGGALNVAATNALSFIVQRGQPLVGMDLSYLNLAGANFRGALMDQVSLQGTKLLGATFVQACMSRVNLKQSMLKESNFKDWARVRDADMLTSAVISNNGKVMVVAGFNGVITLYDAPTGRDLATISGHSACVTGLALSSDAQFVVSGAEDATVRVWDATSGAQRLRLLGHTDNVTCVALSPDNQRIASGSDDNTVMIWSVEKGDSLGQLAGHKGTIWSVCFSPSGTKLLTASEDKRCVAWSVEKECRFLAQVAELDCAVKIARYSHNGRMIAIAGDDGTVVVFDNYGEQKHVLEGHVGAVWTLAFSPTQPVLCTGGADRSIRLWDVNVGVLISSNYWHGHELRSVSFNADGSMICSAACDRTAKMSAVFLDETSILNEDTLPPSAINGLSFSDGRRLTVTNSTHSFVYDVQTGYCARYGEARGAERLKCSVCPRSQHGNRRRIFIGTDEFRILVLLDYRDSPNASATATVGSGSSAHPGRRGRTDAKAGAEETIGGSKPSSAETTLHSLRFEIETTIMEHGESPLVSVDATPDGSYVVSATLDNYVRIFSISDTIKPDGTPGCESKLLHEIDCDDVKVVNKVVVSSDGRFVVAACADKTLRTFSTEDGSEILMLEGHRSSVTCVALSPDNRVVISGSADRSVRMWDAGEGTEVRAFAGHCAAVTSVTSTPDCSEIYSASLDGTIRIWDVLSGAALACIVTHLPAVIAVSSDLKAIASGSFDGTVRVYMRVDQEWSVVRQLGPRRQAALTAYRLRDLEAATDATKAVKYLLQSLSEYPTSLPDPPVKPAAADDAAAAADPAAPTQPADAPPSLS